VTNALKKPVTGELRYADPSLRQRSILLAFAIACGTTQLVIALGLFLWWAFGNPGLAVSFAILDIIGGVMFFLVGCTCLIVHDHLSEKRGVDTAHRRRSLATWILLFSNIPVGIACVAGTSMLKDAHSLVVRNQRPVGFDACYIVTPDRKISLGRIASGQSARCWFRVHQAGSIQLILVRGGTQTDTPVLDVAPDDGPVTQVVNLTNGGFMRRRYRGIR
jgi:hypothetical protein